MKIQATPQTSAKNPMLLNLLTTEEVAEQLKLAPKTVRALCSSRRITAILVCRRWRIPAEELERFKRDRLSSAV
jgi:excisionase family DNA binding protein